ncbi:antiterminator LoaP [Melghirimyces algeriensis]|uniref:Transcriptional antiterminator NusG n=1 Tax=Melghirimyces algeriensis TaxID=910412 RepID=A0A521F5N7_9BACL|nr:antiterminator LoaP [Melghirimyces algeriensis]SMO91457.1 transcriptional antiterminator NusG [Melghirimyces algeriensis]
MGWYALFVETGKEDLVRTMIDKHFDKSIQVIVPKRKLQERKQGRIYEVYKTLFPGYLFVNTLMNVETYHDLKQIPRCYRLLNKYNHRDSYGGDWEDNRKNPHKTYLFSKIDDEEMALILQLIGNEETIDYSTLYVENAKVTVCDGPLKGKEGIIKKVDKRKKRARILLEFMGNEKELDVGIKLLKVYET